MSINWKTEIPLRLTTPEVKERIRELITAERYGFGDGQWTLTDILHMHRDDFQTYAKQIIEGVTQDTGSNDSRECLKDTNGNPMTFRIRILTRQACWEDKNGEPLGLFNKDPYIRSRDIYCRPEDKPECGDIVKWPGEHYMYNPDGTVINQFQKMEMRARGQDLRRWFKFIVDENSSIVSQYMPAIEMLNKHGKRLVFPEFKRAAKGEKQREITNWWFEEIPLEVKTRKERSDKGVPRTQDTNTVVAN